MRSYALIHGTRRDKGEAQDTCNELQHSVSRCAGCLKMPETPGFMENRLYTFHFI